MYVELDSPLKTNLPTLTLAPGEFPYNSVRSLTSLCVHPIETSYARSRYLPDGSAVWTFDTAGISVGLFYRMGTRLVLLDCMVRNAAVVLNVS